MKNEYPPNLMRLYRRMKATERGSALIARLIETAKPAAAPTAKQGTPASPVLGIVIPFPKARESDRRMAK